MHGELEGLGVAGDIWFWSLILAFSSFKSWTLRNVHVEGRVLRRVTMTITVFVGFSLIIPHSLLVGSG